MNHAENIKKKIGSHLITEINQHSIRINLYDHRLLNGKYFDWRTDEWCKYSELFPYQRNKKRKKTLRRVYQKAYSSVYEQPDRNEASREIPKRQPSFLKFFQLDTFRNRAKICTTMPSYVPTETVGTVLAGLESTVHVTSFLSLFLTIRFYLRPIFAACILSWQFSDIRCILITFLLNVPRFGATLFSRIVMDLARAC